MHCVLCARGSQIWVMRVGDYTNHHCSTVPLQKIRRFNTPSLSSPSPSSPPRLRADLIPFPLSVFCDQGFETVTMHG